MTGFARPKIVVSKCLGFDACRYNGEMIPNRLLRLFQPHVDYLLVCPEVEIGLGIPRDPIRIVADGGARTLVQPSTGLELTKKMRTFSADYTAALPEVDGFVLKSRSPSCGVTDAKVHRGPEKSDGVSARGPGLFAEAVLDRFPDVAVEDEGRLTNYRIREHFLARVFTTAEFRRIAKRPRMNALVEFQATNKLLFMSLNQTRMREMGRVVGNHEKLPVKEVFARYGKLLPAAFARPARYTNTTNVLMHALGYFKDGLTKGEKALFLDLLQQYREGKIPLTAVNTVLRSWIVRFGEEYLERQTFFRPFPDDLVEITDSGKGRGK